MSETLRHKTAAILGTVTPVRVLPHLTGRFKKVSIFELTHLYLTLHPWVVKALDVIKDISSSFLQCAILSTVYSFPFKHSKEILGCS